MYAMKKADVLAFNRRRKMHENSGDPFCNFRILGA